MIIIDLIFVCLYWQWGEGGFEGWVGRAGKGWEKSMGRSHRARDLAQRMRPCQGLPRKSGFLLKRKQFGVESLGSLLDANKLLLKGSSFVERLGCVFASPLRRLPASWKKNFKNLGNSGSLAFPAQRGKFPGDVGSSSHTRHDLDSCSQTASKKKAISERF